MECSQSGWEPNDLDKERCVYFIIAICPNLALLPKLPIAVLFNRQHCAYDDSRSAGLYTLAWTQQ
jgi:hypothetical protein